MEKQTKYIKVNVADRLPEEGYYFSFRNDIGENIVRFTNGKWALPDDTIYRVTHWLEKVPNREEEMRDLLEELHGMFSDNADMMGDFTEFYENKISRLLNK